MKHKIFQMAFSRVYPLYIQKAEKKGRTKEEVDTVICWLTGYDEHGLQTQIVLRPSSQQRLRSTLTPTKSRE